MTDRPTYLAYETFLSVAECKAAKSSTLGDAYANAKWDYDNCGGHARAARAKAVMENISAEITERTNA